MSGYNQTSEVPESMINLHSFPKSYAPSDTLEVGSLFLNGGQWPLNQFLTVYKYLHLPLIHFSLSLSHSLLKFRVILQQ